MLDITKLILLLCAITSVSLVIFSQFLSAPSTYDSSAQNPADDNIQDAMNRDYKTMDLSEITNSPLSGMPSIPSPAPEPSFPSQRAVPSKTGLRVADLEKKFPKHRFSRAKNPFFILGAYPEVEAKYATPYYHLPDYGLYNDNDYCEIVDFYNLVHPENMFEQMNFFVDYSLKGAEMVRAKYVAKYANDTMKHISFAMTREDFNSKKYHLAPQINNFFTKRADIHSFHKIGQHFACATQMLGHIPGHESIWRKDYIVDSANNYAARYKDRPECFGDELYFPKTYRLYNKGECKEFFKIMNSKAFKESLNDEPMQYLIKIGYGVHRALGVFLLDDNQTATLNKDYESGKLCGKVNKSLIAQKYVANPLLLDHDNKFDFRIYMLVASTNPLIVYYHDGFLRVSVTPYDKFSNERNVHLTNTFVAKAKFQEAKNENKTIMGMNETQLKDYHIWEFERLQAFLLETNKTTDTSWVDNYLRPHFKQAFIHVVRMGGHAFWNQSNVYEFFGLDFMLDDELNLWYIECNASPQFIETNDRSLAFLVTMLQDMFEIQYAYYRSRMSRVLKVIKAMQAEEDTKKKVDYNKWRAEYQEAVKNRLEPEYQVKENNTFHLIMDESRDGADAYFGFISPECV